MSQKLSLGLDTCADEFGTNPDPAIDDSSSVKVPCEDAPYGQKLIYGVQPMKKKSGNP